MCAIEVACVIEEHCLYFYKCINTIWCRRDGSSSFLFLSLCVSIFNYLLAGLKISFNLSVSFGRLKDSLVSLSPAVIDTINLMLFNPADFKFISPILPRHPLSLRYKMAEDIPP